MPLSDCERQNSRYRLNLFLIHLLNVHMSLALESKRQVGSYYTIHCTPPLTLCQQAVLPPFSMISYLSQPRDLRQSRVEELLSSFQQLIVYLCLFSFWVALLPHIHSHFLLVVLLQMILDQKQFILTLLKLIHLDYILLAQSQSHLTNVLQVL